MNKKSKTIIYIIYILAVLFFLFGQFLFYPLQTNEEIEKKLIKEYEALGYTNVMNWENIPFWEDINKGTGKQLTRRSWKDIGRI